MDNKQFLEEVWKNIPGYPGYQASTEGNIRSKRKTREFAVLKPSNNGRYLFLRCFDKSGVGKSERVHRLVAKTFLGKPTLGQEVNHKNGKRLDNRLVNLEWCTREQNRRHAIETGLHVYKNKSGHTGVYKNNRGKFPWEATACGWSLRYRLGRFKTKKQAIEAVELFRRLYKDRKPKIKLNGKKSVFIRMPGLSQYFDESRAFDSTLKERGIEL